MYVVDAVEPTRTLLRLEDQLLSGRAHEREVARSPYNKPVAERVVD